MALFSSSSITTTPTAIIPSADIANLRLNYQPAAQALIESTVSSSPFTQFNEWFASAKRTVVAPHEPNAMHLSTASIERDEEGRVVRVVPSGRIVLLKGVEEPFIKVAADGKNEDPSHDGREGGGFIFYTNYRSKKARDLDGNPAAALTFYW